MAHINTNSVNKTTAGGLFSFLSFLASTVFFGAWVFGETISNVPLAAAGAFCLSLAFVLQRLGV